MVLSPLCKFYIFVTQDLDLSHLDSALKHEVARFTIRVECGADANDPEFEAIASVLVEGHRNEFRGLLIAALRLIRGQTQKELARKLGICPRSVIRLESGNPFTFGLDDVEAALEQSPGALKFKKLDSSSTDG